MASELRVDRIIPVNGVPTGGGGGIIQMVQGSTSTTVTVTTATYTDTGLSATITPTSASSKILVMVNQHVRWSAGQADSYMGMRLYRDSTVIHEPLSSGSGNPFEFGLSCGGSSALMYTRASITHLDSPASTSSLTYKTQGRPYSTSNSGLAEFQVSAAGSNGTSYIILMEVSG